MDRVKIYRAQDRTLPSALGEILEFNDLSDKDRKEFHARLRYVEEITQEISEWLIEKDTDLRTFLGNIELLLYINQGAPKGDEPISAYLIHSSWTFGSSAEKMRKAVSRSLLEAINAAIPTTEAVADDFERWVQSQNDTLKQALDGFYTSTDIHGVLGHLLVIDIALNNLLGCALRVRLQQA